MKQLPAYLKDTTQFLCEITDIPVQIDTWLVTVDVKSLYTNIPNDEGIQACYEAWLTQETFDPQHPPAEVLRHLLEMVLKLNTFEFNDKHYLQKFGTAMGSKLAPAYANVFMGKLEDSILTDSPLKPIYYRRFIDDIFMIWPHPEKELEEFLTHMNGANDSIKFTHEKSKKEIVFLDTVVYKGTNPSEQEHNTLKLEVKTHIKPTNKQLYVREDSYHPPGTGKGVMIGEAIRYLRTNSEPEQFHKMLRQHRRNLAKRGYPRSKTTAQLRNIKFNERTSRALKTNSKTSNKHGGQPEELKKPTFVTRYCPNARRAFRIVHKHWSTINTNIPVLRRFIRVAPRLAFRANANLAKRLVRAKLRKPLSSSTTSSEETTTTTTTTTTVTHQTINNERQPYNVTLNDDNNHIKNMANLKHQADKHGNNKITLCSDSHCPLHTRLSCSRTVRSRVSRRTFHAHGSANCDTPRVVYLIQCKRCGRQYVGQTSQSLRRRFTRHLQAIRNTHQPGVLHEHFRKDRCAGTDNITIQILHVITSTVHDTAEQTETNLKNYESLWMNRLKCEYPQGLNWAKYDPRKRASKKQ